MKFSIIMPIFNSEKYLSRSIECIRNQTFKDWELILIDDGSLDNSYTIALDYSKKDSRIFVTRQQNKGSGVARNKGLGLARGEYIIFCDADDYYNENAFLSFYENASKDNPDLIISNYDEFYYTNTNEIVIKERRNIASQLIKDQYQIKNKYYGLCKSSLINAPWGKAYKASVIRENNIIFEDIRRCQDVVFNLRFFNHINSLSVIGSKTYNYHTPIANVYLSKFPVDMYQIVIDVYLLRMKYLEQWEIIDSEIKSFFNTALLKDLIICLRLNDLNKWNLNYSDQKELNKNIIYHEVTSKILEQDVTGLYARISKLILKTKNNFLIGIYIKIINIIKNTTTI